MPKKNKDEKLKGGNNKENREDNIKVKNAQKGKETRNRTRQG
jgi:hypothetical protein